MRKVMLVVSILGISACSTDASTSQDNLRCKTDFECAQETHAKNNGEQMLFPEKPTRIDCDHPFILCDDEGA